MGVTVGLADSPAPVERRLHCDQSDEGLVARVRAGDDSAFEGIYDRYARGVLAFCIHMLGNREEAEDALQLTFVSAYRALHSGSAEISLRAWLYAIARNRCLSELRVRRDAVSVDGAVAENPYLVGPAEHVQQQEQLREIFEDVQRLPADQRAALVLFELGDHSHAEIATVLGVRRQKVKALIFQAREGLLRGRRARDSSCSEIREEIATIRGTPPARSMTQAHLDRCPACAAYEQDVRSHRAALLLIVPVLPIAELKTWVLHSSVSAGHGIAAAGIGAGGGGTALVGGGAAGGVATGGAAGAGAGTAASGIGVAAAAPSASALATGAAAAGADISVVGAIGSSSGGIVAKLVTVVAVATGVVGTAHLSHPLPTATPMASAARAATPSGSAVETARPRSSNGQAAKPTGPSTMGAVAPTPATPPVDPAPAPVTTPATGAASAGGSSTDTDTPSSSPAAAAPGPSTTGGSGSSSAPPANPPTGAGNAGSTPPSDAGNDAAVGPPPGTDPASTASAGTELTSSPAPGGDPTAGAPPDTTETPAADAGTDPAAGPPPDTVPDPTLGPPPDTVTDPSGGPPEDGVNDPSAGAPPPPDATAAPPPDATAPPPPDAGTGAA